MNAEVVDTNSPQVPGLVVREEKVDGWHDMVLNEEQIGHLDSVLEHLAEIASRADYYPTDFVMSIDPVTYDKKRDEIFIDTIPKLGRPGIQIVLSQSATLSVESFVVELYHNDKPGWQSTWSYRVRKGNDGTYQVQSRSPNWAGYEPAWPLINYAVAGFIPRLVELQNHCEANIPDSNIVVVERELSPDKDELAAMLQKQELNDGDLRRALLCCQSLGNRKAERLEDVVWTGYEVVGKYAADKMAHAWADDMFKTSVFLALQQVAIQPPYKRTGLWKKNELDIFMEQEGKYWGELITQLLENVRTIYARRKAWQTDPEQRIEQAKEVLKAEPVREIFYYGDITRMSPPLRILDIGGGADESPEGFPPQARRLAALGYEVVNIDLGPNKRGIVDGFTHIQLYIYPDLDLPGVLQRIGLGGRYDVISSKGLADDDSSPTSRYIAYGIGGSIRNKWGAKLLQPEGKILI